MRQNRHFQKMPWKQTQFNLCSIYGSEQYITGHLKDVTVSTISIKYNEKLSYRVQDRQTSYHVQHAAQAHHGH